jgi:hypothetical protein
MYIYVKVGKQNVINYFYVFQFIISNAHRRHSGTKTNFQNKKTVAYEKSQLLIFIKITIIFGLENSNSS